VQVTLGGACAQGILGSWRGAAARTCPLSARDLQLLFIADVKEFCRTRALLASRLRWRAYKILQSVLHEDPLVAVDKDLIEMCVLVGAVSTATGRRAYGDRPASAAPASTVLSDKVNFDRKAGPAVLRAYRGNFQHSSTWDIELPSGCTGSYIEYIVTGIWTSVSQVR
jgi:hypothetical protein